jgi:mTERF domain-containing protein
MALLQREFDFTDREMARLSGKNAPHWASSRPTMDYLANRLSLSPLELRSLMISSSLLFKLLPADLEQQLDFLEGRLSFSQADVRRLLQAHPKAVTFSADEDMEPAVAFLEDRLQLHSTAIQRLILKMPALLGYSVDNDLTPKLDLLEDRLVLTVPELRSVVTTFPMLLGQNIEQTLQPKLLYLRHRLYPKRSPEVSMGLVRRHVLQHPGLFFGLDAERDFEPSIKFFEALLGSSEQALKFVSEDISVINASLDKRLRPRQERVEEWLGASSASPPARVTEEIARRMCFMTDAQFTEYISKKTAVQSFQ